MFPKEITRFKDSIDYQHNTMTHLSKGVYIKGVSLKQQPISLFYQPYLLIKDYYQNHKVAVNETKVIFLGSEGVGKTHTIKRILNNNHKICDEIKETPGIMVTYKDFSYDKEKYRINFWDFGGQEIMHAMHRCFLTDRTGYVVVVSTRFGDVNKQARYWLRSIDSFTNSAPVVVFANSWSEGTHPQLDENSLRRDFPNIVEVKVCSAKDDNDDKFSDLVDSIKRMALSNDSIGMLFPESWERVRQDIIDLGQEGSKKYYISQQTFSEICCKNGIKDEGIQKWLLDWFNDLGECFSYQFEKGNLIASNDLKVLNPEWLTNAIYIIIREARDLAVNGFVTHEGILRKLKNSDKGTLRDVNYSPKECEYILEVMRKFRLSYKVPGRSIEFMPALLHDNTPSDLEYDGKAISYEMRYKSLPENVVHNLMIMMYPYLDHQRCWRKGAVIDVRSILNIGLLSVLDMSREDDVLRIKVYSFANHAPWELLQEIRTRLLDINSSMNLKAEDFIIIDTQEEVSVDKLLDLIARKVTFYQGSKHDYNIKEILGDAFGSEQVRQMEMIEYQDIDEQDREVLGEKITAGSRKDAMKAALNQPYDRLLLTAVSSMTVNCKTICSDLLSICAQIQSNPMFWNVKENLRNTQVRDLLRNRGRIVNDQTFFGHAWESLNPGELDLMIMKNSNEPLTIIEAMNIDSVNNKYIYNHLKRLLDDYNPAGFHELFLVAYVKKAKNKFQSFWRSYCQYLKETDVDNFIFINLEEKETENYFIKHALAQYDCDGAIFTVHHICMRVGE